MCQPVQYIGLLNPSPVYVQLYMYNKLYIIHHRNTYSASYGARTHLQQKINYHCVLKSRSSFQILGKVNQRLHLCREYLMYYRVPDFLAILCFGSSTAPSSLSRQQVVSLFLSLPLCHQRSSLLTGEGGGGGVGAKSYDSEKAWSSINHAILCIYVCRSACLPLDANR
jgi:hypothetical protein